MDLVHGWLVDTANLFENQNTKRNLPSDDGRTNERGGCDTDEHEDVVAVENEKEIFILRRTSNVFLSFVGRRHQLVGQDFFLSS